MFFKNRYQSNHCCDMKNQAIIIQIYQRSEKKRKYKIEDSRFIWHIFFCTQKKHNQEKNPKYICHRVIKKRQDSIDFLTKTQIQNLTYRQKLPVQNSQ